MVRKMVRFEAYVTREISKFIWDGFCDPVAVGVNIFKILDGASLVGVDLTDDQKKGVQSHANNFGDWISDDEEVRDAIAFATDCVDNKTMFAWLAFIVGDTTANELVRDWELEAQEILDRFDRENSCHTMKIKEWKSAFNEGLKETDDPDEQDAIKAAADLLDDDDLEDNAFAINYVASDPIDFIVLPYGATTKAEQKLCMDLAIN